MPERSSSGGRLEAARGDDDGRRLDGQLDDLAARGERARRHARRRPSVDEHALDGAVDDDPRARVGGVLQVGLERRLLAALLAAGVAVAAERGSSAAEALRGSTSHESPRASRASAIIRFVRFGLVASTFTCMRSETASRCASNSGPSSPSSPSAAHSARISAGGRRQTIELITVPPPSVAPASRPIEPRLRPEEPAAQVQLARADELELAEVGLVAVAGALEHDDLRGRQPAARRRSRCPRRPTRSRRRRPAAWSGRRAARSRSSSAPARAREAPSRGPGSRGHSSSGCGRRRPAARRRGPSRRT